MTTPATPEPTITLTLTDAEIRTLRSALSRPSDHHRAVAATSQLGAPFNEVHAEWAQKAEDVLARIQQALWDRAGGTR